MSDQIPFPHFPLQYSLAQMLLFDPDVLHVYFKGDSQAYACYLCQCAGWRANSRFEPCLCFYPVRESVTSTRRLITREERREGGMDCHGNQVEHDCEQRMLLDAGKVRVMGQWFDRLGTGHQ